MSVPSCFLGIVALWSLAILAFERFFVICRPLKNVRLGGKHAAMGLIFVWTFSFIWTIPPVLGWNSYTVSKIGTTCEPNWWAQNTISLNVPSFIHSNYPVFVLLRLTLTVFQTLSVFHFHAHVLTEQHPQWYNITLLMNTKMHKILKVAWFGIKQVAGVKASSCVLYYDRIKETTYNPKAHAMQPSVEKLLSRDWWLGLGLGTQTVQKHLNRECALTHRWGNIFYHYRA